MYIRVCSEAADHNKYEILEYPNKRRQKVKSLEHLKLMELSLNKLYHQADLELIHLLSF